MCRGAQAPAPVRVARFVGEEGKVRPFGVRGVRLGSALGRVKGWTYGPLDLVLEVGADRLVLRGMEDLERCAEAGERAE